MSALRRALLLAALAGATPASAADLVCESAGHQYKIGDYACIPACHGKMRYARCDAVKEAASWTFISDACPSALLAPTVPLLVTLAPPTSAMTPRPLLIDMTPVPPELKMQKAALSAAF